MALQIGGIASGMDTESIIKDLMRAESVRLNKYNQNKQTKLWTQEAYNDINKKIANFILDTKKELGLNITTSTGVLLSGSSSSFSWVKKASSSNEDLFTATATANAVTGSHTISVERMATGVSMASTSNVYDDTIENLLNLAPDETYTVNINGQEVTFSKDDNLSTVAKKINDSVDGVQATYDSSSKRFFLSTKSTGYASQIFISGDDKSFFRDVLKLNDAAKGLSGASEDRYKLNYNTSETSKLSSLKDMNAMGIDENTTLENILPSYDWVSNSHYLVNINGENIAFSKDDSVLGILDKINSASVGITASIYNEKDVSIEYNNSNDSVKDLSSVLLGKDKTLEEILSGYDWNANDNKYNVNINGNDISFSKTDTLQNVEDALTGIGISADFDLTNQTFTIDKNQALTITEDRTDLDNSLFNKLLDLSDESYYTKLEEVSTGNKYINIKTDKELNIIEDGKDASESLFNKLIDLGASNVALAGKTESIESVIASNETGQDAMISFDGAENIEYSSNQFTINGIQINLKDKDPGKIYNINIDTDVQGVYDKIKSFVDQYNELIDNLNKKISEKRYRDYHPLSDEEKQAMDEKTIELWEEKAKSGLLRNDENIERILSSTRSGLYESVYSEYTDDEDNTNDVKLSGYSHLTEIGITTGSYQEKGKLVIDEIKLKEAIENDVDSVIDLLFSTSDISESSADTKEEKAQRRSETGIINRIYDDLVTGMKDIIDKAGPGDDASLYRNVKSTLLLDFVTKGGISNIGKDIMDIEKRISGEQNKLINVENRYWRQFTAMEKAMNEMNAQSSWLMSQMGMSM